MNLNQVTITSSDVNRSVEFYLKLGLELIVNSAPRYVRFQCPNGDATFSIHEATEPAKLTSGGISIYFECEDLDQRVAELKKIGVLFDSDPIDQSWLWREAHLRDPDGNHLILYHAGEHRKNPPWRIK